MTSFSLKTRLLTAAAGFITLALLIAASGLTVLFERHVKTWIDGELGVHLDQLISGVEAAPDGRLTVVRAPSDPRFNSPLSGLYWQVVEQGASTELRSRSLWDHAIALPADPGIGGRPHQHNVTGPNGQMLHLLERHIEMPARMGRKTARFAVALDEAEITSAVWRFAGALFPFLLVLGGLLIAASWVQVSIGLRPLQSISHRIADIRSGAAQRLDGDFPEEVRPLAREIDTLLDARDQQIQSARTRAADLAHGLKTPLQVVMGGIARLKARGDTALAGDLENAATMMQRHVDRQLAHARLQGGRGTGAAELEPVVRQVVRVLERSPDGERLQWRVTVPAGLWARIHPDDLAEALGGLAENASRHARTSVAVGASMDDDRVSITVRDDGPGIPDSKVSEAVLRGTRLDTASFGSGLGLAIVSDIASAWGGELSFHRNGDRDFCVTLHLPRASSPKTA